MQNYKKALLLYETATTVFMLFYGVYMVYCS